MKRSVVIYVLLLVSSTSACSSSGPTQTNYSLIKVADPQATKTADPQNLEPGRQIAQIASTAKGKVGVSALVLEAGETDSLNPRDHLAMQSVYQLPIQMNVMKHADARQ